MARNSVGSVIERSCRRLLGPHWVKIITCVILAAWPTASLAIGPLPEQCIPPECDWVVHVDTERLAKAHALKPVFDALTASAMGASLAEMGIDATMDVTTITMFGTIARSPDAPGETTTVLQGGPALRAAILQHVERHDGYTLMLRRSSQADGRNIDAWTIDGLSIHIALVPMSAAQGDTGEHDLIAVLSDNAERLRANIDNLLAQPRSSSGPQPGADWSSNPGALAVPSPWEHPTSVLHERQPPVGSVIFACARNLNESQPPPSSGLLASARNMVAHFGYRDDEGEITVFAGLELEGHERADMDTVVSSFNHMIDYWSDRIAERSRLQPEMLTMLPIIKACHVTKEDRIVRLRLERKILSTASADSPSNPSREGGTERKPRDSKGQ